MGALSLRMEHNLVLLLEPTILVSGLNLECCTHQPTEDSQLDISQPRAMELLLLVIKLDTERIHKLLTEELVANFKSRTQQMQLQSRPLRQLLSFLHFLPSLLVLLWDFVLFAAVGKHATRRFFSEDTKC